jgi:DNA-binding NtrC family response regulator
MKVLIADDERSLTELLVEDLKERGHEVEAVARGDQALQRIGASDFDVLITDMNMPGMNGDKLLGEVRRLRPSTAVVVITGYGTVQSAVAAMKAGAADYVLKPFVNEQLALILERLQHLRTLEAENKELRERVEEPALHRDITGSSPVMQTLLRVVRTVAPSESNILITGETGTGKELLAKAVHGLSLRASGPLVSVSCAAIPSTLLEDELFGHEKGAFTDARERKLGRIERANGGTFFLDDIDDMALATQVKLLRVLQEREVERLGGSGPIKVDIRVVAATKVDLRLMVREGRFREDLFYRLNVVPLRLPPLRERLGDVPLLVQHFIRKYGHGVEYRVPEKLMQQLEDHHWPGNVRELEHSVERAIALCGEDHVLTRDHMLERDELHPQATPAPVGVEPLLDLLARVEREHIQKALQLCTHKSQAAHVLGISRKVLWNRMRALGLGDSDNP